VTHASRIVSDHLDGGDLTHPWFARIHPHKPTEERCGGWMQSRLRGVSSTRCDRRDRQNGGLAL